MKSKIIIAIILILFSSYLIANSSEIGSTHIQTDTTHQIQLITENIQDQSWWDKYWLVILGPTVGAFFGAIFAGLLALFTIHKTNLFSYEFALTQEKVNSIKDHHKLTGVLFLILIELENHQLNVHFIKKEIQSFTQIVKKAKKLITSTPFSKLPNEMLKECRGQFLSFDSFDIDLVSMISAYVNLTDRCNKSLDLSDLQAMVDNIDQKIFDIKKGVDAKISETMKLLNTLEGYRKNLSELLILHIKRDPSIKFDPKSQFIILFPPKNNGNVDLDSKNSNDK